MILKLLKSIRAIRFINWTVRTLLKLKKEINHIVFACVAKHWVVSGIIKVALPQGEKFKLYSKGDDYIPTQVYWKGYKGYEESVEIFYYLAKRAKIIFDIGANIGYYSLVASAANNEASIFAFEPVPRIMDRFKKQIKINDFNNIHPEMLVASNNNQKIPFYIPKGDSMAMASSAKKGWVKEVDEVLIDAITLDEYKRQHTIGKIDLIKMDCEFHEWEVLQGMQEILQQDKPDILMEVLLPEWEGVKGYFEDNSYLFIQDYLKQHGYYIYLIYKGALIKVPNIEFNPIERNYLFSVQCSSQIYTPIKQFINLYA